MKDTSTRLGLTFLTLCLILSSVSSQEGQPQKITEDGLRDDFASIDKNKDGFIDAHELRTAIPNINEDDITSFFDRYDSDRNAVITLEEYLMILHTEYNNQPQAEPLVSSPPTEETNKDEGQATPQTPDNRENVGSPVKKKKKKGKKAKSKAKAS